MSRGPVSIGVLLPAVLWMLAFAVSGVARRASAQPLPFTEEAEAAARAFAEGEIAEAQRLAGQAIATGQHEAATLAPLYVLSARCKARIGDEEGARVDFVRALALDPGYRLPNVESDDVRSRYLEARGYWASRPRSLAVDARRDAHAPAIILSVTDPAQLAARVRLRVRAEGDETYRELMRLPSSYTTATLPGLDVAQPLELTLTLLDEYGNRLWQAGSDTNPMRLPATPPEPAPAPPPVSAAPASAPTPRLVASQAVPGALELPSTPSVARADSRRTPVNRLLIAGSLALVSAGSLAAGFITLAARERSASRWNEGRCSGSGVTRGERCADERRDIRRYERWTAGMFTLSGATLLGGVILLVWAPRAYRVRESASARAVSRVRCQSGPGTFGAACSLVF